VTLTGVTLLFACAQANGTMARAVAQALRLCRGQARWLPPAFFMLAALAAMVGPGAILSTALIAPFAMNTGVRAGLPPFLIALMVCNGANAGNLSPFSTTGAIASALMTRSGLGGHEFRVWIFHAAAHVLVGSAAYVLCGGIASWRRTDRLEMPDPPRLERVHVVTAAVTAAWIASVILLRWPLGWPALAAAVILLLLRAAPAREAVRRMPWKIIALVVTISTAVGALERAGGLAWFENALARVATPRSVHGVVAFVMGVISAYSSTSGVVLPAFLPLAPPLAARLAGVDALALAITIVIGSALVDVSPLSTLGALTIAAAPEGPAAGALFRKLMIWGLAMTVVGAGLCYLASPLFRVGTR
ncbi:MAG TPA: SLC13 family permease, partial [Bryobacteraceae bacterium]|nr:SLC13 family permease [Bryobacteraceae bacterium]